MYIYIHIIYDIDRYIFMSITALNVKYKLCFIGDVIKIGFQKIVSNNFQT